MTFTIYNTLEDLALIFGTLLLLYFAWYGWNFFLSQGGWKKLHSKYLANKRSPSLRLRIRTTGIIGSSKYKNALYVGAHQDGLWLSTSAIHSSCHQSLIIPWEAFEPKVVKLRSVHFVVLKVDDIEISFLAAAWANVVRFKKYLYPKKAATIAIPKEPSKPTITATDHFLGKPTQSPAPDLSHIPPVASKEPEISNKSNKRKIAGISIVSD